MTNKSLNTDLHGMVDIETMNTTTDAAIITIGACVFDPYGQDTEESITTENRFSATISFTDNEKQGRTFGADTIAWWLKQSKDAQEGLQDGDITNLRKALTQYNQFWTSQKGRVSRIWAKSPDFDIVILRDALKSQGMMDHYKYWETRCVRTITEAAYPNGDQPIIGVGVAHNAVDDAIRQALMVQHCNRVIAGRISPRNQ